MLVKFENVGQYGMNKDLSQAELPPGAWTDTRNIRFLDGYAYQFYGHSEVYNSPSIVPQYTFALVNGSIRYWIYAGAAKTYAVTSSGGTVTHTDLTHATPRAGVVNQWTHAIISGLPILNVGDTSKIPMYWDLNLANKFVDLTNWTAGVYCKSLRSFGYFLVALNVTAGGSNFPTRVKWSSPASAGALPGSWDHTDAAVEAGQIELASETSPIIDGLELRNSFMIYTENSTHRMTYNGGPSVFSFQKIFTNSGILNRNCAVEFEGYHFVVTGSDVIVHDGQSMQSVMDKQTRRYLFQNIDVTYRPNVFVFRNPFLNEIFVAYPSIGSSVCDKAMVYNHKDKTVSFRDLPSVNHANYGLISNDLGGTWVQSTDAWDASLKLWNGPDYSPDTQRVMMASASIKLYLLDGSASFDGVIPTAKLERIGLTFDSPETIKLISGIRPRIYGNTGQTVNISVGYSDSPYVEPTYTTMTYTIGTQLKVDCLVSGRYIAYKIENGTAYTWRLDSLDMDVQEEGMY